MDIKTLESFRLGDAIFFHDELNNNLWDENNQLRPEVKNQLLVIAKDFIEELGIKDLDVKDITVSGSNAAYTYTPHSDLDLHILVDISKLPENEVYRELFTAKKNLYNDSHDITVHGVPVELYVQDSAEPVVSIGEYSILKDKWLRIPTKRRANFDQTITKQKYDKLNDIIKKALKSKDLEKVNNIITTIKRYRKAGLDKGGEFGPENLAYKALRTQGYIDKLYDLRNKLHSNDLSIEEGIFYSDPTQLIDLYLRKVDSENLGKTTVTKILQGLPYGNLDKALELISKKYQINPTDIVWQPSRKTNEDYDPNSPPPGPEFKPTMPSGTVKVDVSDVYDWYKLGQHISNMKGLGKHDFGKGPPSTILSFGDEDTEHKYIQDLMKTGLTTTDIDPVDPNQPKGMKKQKVDPTYNVNEKINPEIVKSNYRAETTINVKDVGPLKLKAYNISTEYPQQIRVEVLNKDNIKIGHFRFVVHDNAPQSKVLSFFKQKKDPYLIAGNAVVWDDYQKKGIATEVYKWVKSLGNDIKPSPYQSDAGKAMWQGFIKNKVIDEVFNTKPTRKYSAYWEHEGEDGSTLHFETKDGYEYDLSFIPPWMGADEVKSYDFADVTDEQDDAGRYVEFVQKDPDDWMGGEKGVTGTGSSAEVFGIVVNGILQYVKKYKPPFLMFQAAEVNRRSLYNAMLRRLLPSMPNYKVIGPRKDGAYFVYDSRVIKPKVSEEEKPKQGAKSAIYSTDVYGMTAYHSKCLEPGCDWESKRYDSIKLAQNAAQKHAQKHFKKGVAEGLEQITEYRHRLLQYVKRLLPTWPEYVLKDWLVPNKGDFSNLPHTALKDSIMEKLKGVGLTPNSKWQLIPNMKFTMDMFDPMTKQRLIGRAGGSSDMGLGVPKDKERHATQAQLAQQQGGVRKEPVLLIKTANGYELLEGWHRTIQHFAKYPDGYTGPAYVAVAQSQQGVAEEISESRGSLFSWLKQQFPTWPDYVVKDFLYQQAKTITSQEQLADFLEMIKKDFGKVKWRLEKLPITLDVFTPKTQQMIKSREGGSSNPFKVPKDAERHAQQLKMIQQHGVRTEPIIVAKLNNGYDLIEGWHRTIQHLKVFPEGYTGPAWVGYGATYTSEIAEQSVTESFDQPYPIKWEKSDFGDHDALATLNDGTPLTIMFNGEPKNNWVVDFHRNNSQDVTGEGDAQRVFATVLAAIRQFIIKKKPNGLTFHSIKEADPKGTRTRLYDRLVQRYVQGTGYQLSRVQQPGQVIYKLIPTKNVKEGASGYIPSYAEIDDPRFKSAITKDVRPGTMKKDAKKFGNKISRAGIPPTLKANGKF